MNIEYAINFIFRAFLHTTGGKFVFEMELLQRTIDVNKIVQLIDNSADVQRGHYFGDGRGLKIEAGIEKMNKYYW